MNEHDVSELFQQANAIDVADLPDPRESPEAQRLLESILGAAPTVERPRHRRRTAFALAGGIAGAAVAVVLALTLTRGQAPAPSKFLVQGVHSPTWRGYTGGSTWAYGPATGLPGFRCISPALVLFGCSGIMASAEQIDLAQSSSAPARTAAVVEGGTASQRRLLRSIVRATEPSSIQKIAVGGTDDRVGLRMTSADRSVRSLWEESLVAAAFRDRSRAAKKTLAVSLLNGESRGVIPPGPAKPLPRATRTAAATARQRFETAAAKADTRFEELTIYRPSGVAVAATLRADDPASFLLHEMPRLLAALGDRWRAYDGTYIRLVDESGSTVWETSTNGRTSTGSVGSREDLVGCSPIANWGPTPTPCPVN